MRLRTTVFCVGLLCLGSLLWGSTSVAEENAITKALQPYVDAGEMPGFVSVLATSERTLQVDCVGFADVENQKPMTPDTLFWIASVTKIFTAAATMALVDDGKLSLDDPIDQYFPEFKNLQVAEKNEDGSVQLRPAKTIPTIRQCLCHMTGWPFLAPYMQNGIESLPFDRMITEFSQTPLQADPGVRYEYSQMGIDTVGAIIEQVSGMPYHEFLKQRFFEPLGMTSTTFWPSVEDQKRLVKAYGWKDGHLCEVPRPLIRPPFEDTSKRSAEPGGGLFSTANDLLRFFQMLAGKGMYGSKYILSEAAVAEMGRKQTPDHIGYWYGLGSFQRNERWWGHNGAMRNISLIDTDNGLLKICMMQVDNCPKQREAENDWFKAADDEFPKLVDLMREDYGFLLDVNPENAETEKTGAPKAGVSLWCSNATQKVWKHRALPTAHSNSLKLSAAQNDSESLQLILRPTTASKLTKLEISTFKNTTTGEELEPANSEIRQVYYHRIQATTDDTGIRSEYPDALPPLNLPLELAAEQNQPLWLTVHVPTDAVAGDYEASVTLELQNAEGICETLSVPVKLHVWNFALPEKNTVDTAFGFYHDITWRYHGVKTDADRRKVLDSYLKLLSDYRLNTYHPAPLDKYTVEFVPDAEHPEASYAKIDFSKFDAAMEVNIQKYHTTNFNLNIPGLGHGTFENRVEPSIQGFGENTPEYQAMFSSFVQQLEKHLRDKGWLDMGYVYWFDEPEPKDYEFVRKGMNRIKQFAPGIHTMLTEEASDEVQADNLLGKVDIWCPVTSNFARMNTKLALERGERLWWYVCCGPHAPYCTEFIDHSAVELRTWLWQSWQNNVTGVLIWTSNWWTSDAAFPDSPQNPYEEPMSYVGGYSHTAGFRQYWGNGDGRLCYPPLSCAKPSSEPNFDAPVPCIRLAMLREGIEDYEMLVLLKKELEAAKAAGVSADKLVEYENLLVVPETITKSLTEFSKSPTPIYTQRKKIAEAIEQLKSLRQ